jgi:hypothetical protein
VLLSERSKLVHTANLSVGISSKIMKRLKTLKCQYLLFGKVKREEGKKKVERALISNANHIQFSYQCTSMFMCHNIRYIHTCSTIILCHNNSTIPQHVSVVHKDSVLSQDLIKRI